MEELLIRLLVVVLVIWLGDKILATIPISQEAKGIVSVILLILSVLWLIFGTTFIPIR